MAEPITLTKGYLQSESDQVWKGVSFVDAKNVERQVKYCVTSYAPIEIHHTLILNGKPCRPTVPTSAFFGLLQRWYRANASVRELVDNLELKRIDASALTEQQRAAIAGVSIMRALSEAKLTGYSENGARSRPGTSSGATPLGNEGPAPKVAEGEVEWNNLIDFGA